MPAVRALPVLACPAWPPGPDAVEPPAVPLAVRLRSAPWSKAWNHPLRSRVQAPERPARTLLPPSAGLLRRVWPPPSRASPLPDRKPVLLPPAWSEMVGAAPRESVPDAERKPPFPATVSRPVPPHVPAQSLPLAGLARALEPAPPAGLPAAAPPFPLPADGSAGPGPAAAGWAPRLPVRPSVPRRPSCRLLRPAAVRARPSQCARARLGPPAPPPFPWFPFAPRLPEPARLPPRFPPVFRNRRDDAALSLRPHRSSWSASFFPLRRVRAAGPGSREP